MALQPERSESLDRPESTRGGSAIHRRVLTWLASAAVPDLETPFAVYRDLFRGECVEQGDYNYLRITLEPQGESDERTPPWRNTAVESIGFGLHLVDYQIPLGDLLQAVAAPAPQ